MNLLYNLDAELALIMSTAKHPLELVEMLDKAVEKGNRWLEAEGFTEEDEGHFWGILETRPYMLLRQTQPHFLVELGIFDRAIDETEDMIRLCSNDNLGIRFLLMHLYALAGNEEKALGLLEKYEGEDDTMMLMPLSVLYFRKGDFKTAQSYLKKIMKRNPDLKKFLRKAAFGEEPTEFVHPNMYRPYSIEELYVCVSEHEFLYVTMGGFFIWANDAIVTPPGSSSGKNKGKRKKSVKKKKK